MVVVVEGVWQCAKFAGGRRGEVGVGRTLCSRRVRYTPTPQKTVDQ